MEFKELIYTLWVIGSGMVALIIYFSIKDQRYKATITWSVIWLAFCILCMKGYLA